MIDYGEQEREAVTGSAYGELYRRRHSGRTPRRVMVQKTTKFKQDEVDGQTLHPLIPSLQSVYVEPQEGQQGQAKGEWSVASPRRLVAPQRARP
jgi:hypothetical protein